ncbi:putative cytosolic leucyl aminopeptidase, putative,metallo-peptidase, Clan MF, Family M17 [Trypanosoma theileri]|uniref:Putative cytosolic leucyl aminopeptidase, putative,metallo-peptidase, Clan MF, Family M17 n=1 Tax=Trypanosoma theileri TaxID=67003 RepID=A0A1X0NWS8_9TRYP|nr:putative cytosolic leucyl aminopeptidase, putative,metallo-peptidase, Clan MF, Family M17 [Trypanosoma theileri]ORC89166.1 putative cytosolic leucyl aminopeptidase, putative,metallo-peptidase, Clan MF, Family M17 [Trypanosoma theileri]
MLKQLTSRAPFPASLAVLPWAGRDAAASSSSSTTSGRRRGSAAVEEDRLLAVEFLTAGGEGGAAAAAEKSTSTPGGGGSSFPIGGRTAAGTVTLDSATRRLLAGLGPNPTVRDYRLAITNAVREAQRLRASGLLLRTPPPDAVSSMGDLFQPPSALSAMDVVEKTASFAVTAAYKYDRLRSKKGDDSDGERNPKNTKDEGPMKLFIDSEATEAVTRGNVIGDCINTARNLGNLREDEGIPQLYCEWIQKELTPLGVKVRHILKGERLQRAGLNLLYNVGKGSRHEPYLVVFEYVGNRQSDEATALVGKGVTFDCGGLNVKPYGSMETMHLDMMGAATVMTTIKAIATLQLPVNVVGVVGLVENAIGPNSYYPSSIITSRKGLTVEVLNTDAEGRLVLADALTYVQQDAKLNKKVDTIIDLATLTGAVLVGLGSRRAGLFSNDLKLSQQLMEGGRISGDEVWPMPIGEEHKKAVKGGIADLVNVSTGREAGSCTAAAFLSNFIDDGMKWAHLDIAGAGMGGDKPKGFQPAGAPGFGVQLLVDHFRQNLINKETNITKHRITAAAPIKRAADASDNNNKNKNTNASAGSNIEESKEEVLIMKPQKGKKMVRTEKKGRKDKRRK